MALETKILFPHDSSKVFILPRWREINSIAGSFIFNCSDRIAKEISICGGDFVKLVFDD